MGEDGSGSAGRFIVPLDRRTLRSGRFDAASAEDLTCGDEQLRRVVLVDGQPFNLRGLSLPVDLCDDLPPGRVDDRDDSAAQSGRDPGAVGRNGQRVAMPRALRQIARPEDGSIAGKGDHCSRELPLPTTSIVCPVPSAGSGPSLSFTPSRNH